MAAITEGRTAEGAFTYLAAGDERAPPLVFLHGIGGGAGLWAGQLTRFGDRHRAIAWNMPGYAGSATREMPDIARIAEALADFLAALRIERPILVGHSIGGMIVQSYLAQGLGPVAAAVLAQTSPAFGGRDPTWAKDFVAARLGPLDRGVTMAEIAQESVPGMVGEGADPAGIALALATMASTPPDAYRASTLAMIGFDLRNALGRIAVPTLLVSGSLDRNAPAPTMAKMAEAIPRGRHVCVEGSGHLVMLERPAAFDAAFAAFLSDTVPGDSR